MFNKSLNIPSVIIVFSILLIAIIFFNGTNTLLSLEALVALYLIYKLTWRKDEPPVVYFALMMQVVQVIAIVIDANIKKVDITEVTEFPYHIYEAYHYGLGGIVLLALGYNLVINTVRFDFTVKDLNLVAEKYDAKKLILLYLLIALAFAPLQSFSFSLGPVQQIFYKFLEIKWAFLFIVFFTTIFQGKYSIWFMIIIVIEIGLGFTGFFSNYKEIAIGVLICYLTYNYHLSVPRYLLFLFIGTMLVFLSIMWQYTKTDYRVYVSGESAEQTVVVSKADAFTKFISLIGDFDSKKIETGSDQLLSRVTYINFFSATVNYVPDRYPHENGRLFLDATTRSFMPRFLFPGKTIIDDSELTTKYTGINVYGRESGTSISLGYFAEIYVDFGFPYMLIFVFLIGVLIGVLNKYIFSIAYTKFWAFAYMMPLTFNLYSFEISLAKIIPAIALYMIVIFVFNKFFVKNVDQYILKKE